MKKICMIPVFCIMALCFIFFAPKTSYAATCNPSLGSLPSSVTHGQTLDVDLIINLSPFATAIVEIFPMNLGLTYRSSSIPPNNNFAFTPSDNPTTVHFQYDVNNDVTDRILVRFLVGVQWPGSPPKTFVTNLFIPIVHNPGSWTIVSEATCTTPGTKTTNCTYCMVEMTEEIPATGGVLSTTGHTAGEWIVTTAPTNKTTGTQVLNCTQCGITLETKAVPILREIWPNNTACSLGLRFRDEAPSLTGKWYMYTPVDLSQDGVQTFPLIASNAYIIGSVSITVEDGAATVAYTLHTKKIKVKEEFLTFFPDLAGVKDVEPEKWTEPRFAFGEPILLEEQLHGAASTLMFLRLVIDYDIYADGVVRYYESAYK